MARSTNTYKSDATITIGTSVDTYGINNGLSKIQKAFKKLSLYTGGALSIVGLVRLGKAAIEAASDLQEVQNIVDVSFEEMEYKVEQFCDTCIESFGMSELTAKQMAGSFMAMGKAMDLELDTASDMAIELTGLAGDMASFYNISQDYARVALSAVYTGETETLKRYGIVLTEANLQQYAYSQGISESVKNMDAASKTLLRYNYIMSATADIQGDFTRTSGNWANQVRLLKEQWTVFLNVLGSGLLTVLTPVLRMLNKLMAAVISFAKVIGSALVNIFGLNLQSVSDAISSVADSADDASSSVDDASDSVSDLSDSTSDAADEAERMLGTYDELNVIDQDTDSSSDSGSSGSSGTTDTGITTTDTSLLDEAYNTIEEKLSNITSLFELGETIGNTIKDALDSIDWDTIYAAASSFGTGLAEFLNGLISPELFYSVGRTIANSLNTVLYFLNSFGKEFDWTDFGLSIAAGINGVFENFDFKTFGETIKIWANGIWTTITTALTNINWASVFSGVASFFGGLGVNGLLQWLGLIGLVKLLKWLPKFISSTKATIKLLLQALAEDFATAIGNLVSNTSTATLIKTIGGIGLAISGVIVYIKGFASAWQDGVTPVNALLITLGAAISAIGLLLLGVSAQVVIPIAAIAAGIALILSYLKQTGELEKIKQSLQELWTNVLQPMLTGCLNQCKSIIQSVLPPLKEALQNLSTALSNLWTIVEPFFTNFLIPALQLLWNNILKPFIAWFITAVAVYVINFITKLITAITNVIAIISTVVTLIINKITAVINICVLVYKTTVSVVKGIIKFVENLKTGISTMITEIENDVRYVINDIVTTITSFIDNVETNIGTFIDNAKTTVSNGITAIQTTVTNIINNIKTTVTTVITDIKTTVNTIITNIKTIVTNTVTNIKTSVTNIINAIKSTVHTVVNNIKTTVSNIVDKIKDKVVDVVDTMKTKVKDKINKIKDTFEEVFKDIKKTVGNLMDETWNKVKNVVNSILGGVESMANGVIKGLNKAIDAINNLKFTLPDWVPIVGGKSLGFSIPKLSTVSIPKLATGAVIPPNNEFMAILGDQKRGVNIETPLDTMIQAFNEALDSRGGGNNEPIVLQLNSKVIAEAVWDESEKKYKQTGKSAFAY